MSAHFLIRYRGQPVRFVQQAGKSIYELVGEDEATRFIAEHDAWLAAYQAKMDEQELEVVPA